MNVDVESVACLTDMHESSDPAVMKAARRLYEEWRMGDWAEQQKPGEGDAPWTGAVFARYGISECCICQRFVGFG